MTKATNKKFKLAFATRNLHKALEMTALLGHKYTLRTMDELGYKDDITEDGNTFIENAIIKAETLSRAINAPALADDSGLAVDALGGAPGIYSARYAGTHGDDAANNALLLENLKDTPAPRTARYVCALALARPGLPTLVVEDSCPGEIGFEPDGDGGFGYDPLFCWMGETIPYAYKRRQPIPYADVKNISFARMPSHMKRLISHRARAARRLIQLIEINERRDGVFKWRK